MSASEGRTAAINDAGECPVRAVHAGPMPGFSHECCISSDDREEPILRNAAVSMNGCFAHSLILAWR